MSLYVPLVVRLEVKKGLAPIAFSESSNVETGQSPSIGEKTRRRLMSGMKKRSPPAGSAKDAPLAPEGVKHDKLTAPVDMSTVRGRRTYSEVVVETMEGDRLTQCSEETSIRTAKTGSEPPHDVDHLNYYYGNPFVEKTEGILHFYKYNDDRVARNAQCRMLCMLAIPSHQNVRDLITFIGPVLSTIERIKVVRDSTPNQYMAIVKFKTHNDAVVFYEEFSGVQYNSMEPEKCGLLFVDRIECVGESSSVEEVSQLTELPTCAVCLERMDDGVVSVLCNHTFHALCLQQWADSTCPVCRYIQSPEIVAEQRCSDCGQSTDLWICLICGNIGCGRYAEAHAYRHFELTSHTFCLQIGGERVWDYAGDNYVHRLIQTDEEGKLVEYERGLGDGENMDDKNVKLEGIKMEYTCLLSNQLESQRKFFEARITDVEKAMSNMEKMATAQMDDLERQLTASTSEVRVLRSELAESEKLRTSAEKRHVQTTAKLTKVTNELNEERSMNKMLRGDQQKWKTRIDELEAERKKNEKVFSTKINDMEEQVRDLMLHFEAQNKIQSEVNSSNVTQEEVNSSQIGVGNSPAKESSSKQRRKSNRK